MSTFPFQSRTLTFEYFSIPEPYTYHSNGGLCSDPGGGRVLVQIVSPRIITGPTLVRPRILQTETRHAQNAHTVGVVLMMDSRRLRAPSQSWRKESARLISAYHHWISGVGLPTTSQYSSKVSPVSLVSDRGDFTKPAMEVE
ncbi:unnamed protein product [Coregonus sp. 'balchen']|nr:unnamed protein product [Coregonus sp. 'balchen']